MGSKCWKVGDRWLEREGEGVVQRGQPRKARLETSGTQSEKRKRRWQEEIFLREDDWDAGADEET
jgi:hypothetical protein